LDEIARHYALLMAKADTKNIIVDYGAQEKSMRDLGISSWAVNFASHDRLNDRHNAAFALWANSKSHRANMLDPKFFYMGSGYAVSKSGKCYYCQVLAARPLYDGTG
jgi:uncharacterized protein YkwD